MTQALNTLLEHAEHERDQARMALLQAEDTVRRLNEQAEQLLSYRDEYRLRSPTHGGRAAPIDMLRHHQGFMMRLDSAMQQQQGQLHAAEARGARLRVALMAQEMRVASVRKLLDGAASRHSRPATGWNSGAPTMAPRNGGRWPAA